MRGASYVTTLLRLVSCSFSMSNVLGGFNGHLGGTQARRSKIAKPVKGNPGRHYRSEWFACHFHGRAGGPSQTKWSAANDVSGSEGEDFEGDEGALGEVQG
jgi:hypothetical protein